MGRFFKTFAEKLMTVSYEVFTDETEAKGTQHLVVHSRSAYTFYNTTSGVSDYWGVLFSFICF